MVDYREILRQASQKSSQRSIAASVHCSRHTVSDVLSAAAEKNICWPLDSDTSNEELAKPGVTMTLLWEEYRARCYENGQTPYQSTQFGEKYRRWARVTKAS